MYNFVPLVGLGPAEGAMEEATWPPVWCGDAESPRQTENIHELCQREQSGGLACQKRQGCSKVNDKVAQRLTTRSLNGKHMLLRWRKNFYFSVASWSSCWWENTCVYNYICVSEYVLDLQPFFIRLQAVAIGQALLDAGFLETIAGQPKVFHDDFTLYKPSEV